VNGNVARTGDRRHAWWFWGNWRRYRLGKNPTDNQKDSQAMDDVFAAKKSIKQRGP